ncbi:SCP2 sterol-binding domain-containing protein [bacterium AH-315-N03]|nr:SCP2 sterol-binding domain-containing protein [bacterium AH-315-N03]
MPDAKTDFTENLPNKISGDPDAAKDIDAVFLFKIIGDEGGTWTVNCRDETDLGVKEGEVGEPDVTLELTCEDWLAISDNPSSAMQLYFQGKLKVSGDAMKATKLQLLLA